MRRDAAGNYAGKRPQGFVLVVCMMNEPLLSVKNLKKSYEIRSGLFKSSGVVNAVDGVDLDICPNETLGLVGESGCGKSTLSRLILLLEKPDSGEIIFSGHNALKADRQELKTIRRGMQIIFQDPFGSLNPRQKVLSIIEEPMRVHKTDTNENIRKRAYSLMDMVGLAAQMATRYPHEFSGGQRQRICIARALAINPKLIICDEPVSSLDVSIQAQILNLLTDIKTQFGLSYLFISHDLSVVGYLSDRVAVMYLGRIVEIADAKDIFSSPLHPYTKGLLDAVPSIRNKGRRLELKAAETIQGMDTGCDFYARCPVSSERCRHAKPELEEKQAGHESACFLLS
jgi:oligopeptide/dipeptide ABC transporter ATP-binding protein